MCVLDVIRVCVRDPLQTAIMAVPKVNNTQATYTLLQTLSFFERKTFSVSLQHVGVG